MNESERGRAPLAEGVWPPAPLRAESPPLFLRVEGARLTRSWDRLIVVNLLARRSFLAEVCIVSTYLLSPFISFLRNSFHRATLLPYVLSSYRSHYELYLFTLCVLAVAWSVLYYAFNLGGVMLDGRDATVRANGRRARPMSKIKAVHVKMTPYPFRGRRHIVRLFWKGGRPTPDWKKHLTGEPANFSYLGSFRHEANADQVAAIIAAFIGVPVQRAVEEGGGTPPFFSLPVLPFCSYLSPRPPHPPATPVPLPVLQTCPPGGGQLAQNGV